MKHILSILLVLLCSTFVRAQVVVRVRQGEKIADAIELARQAYVEGGQSAVIEIEPGTYREELTIDVPNLTLRNASKTPSIAMRNGGVDIDEQAVRITWYYGHGYQYGSMGSHFNYGGSKMRRWNASVLVTAPGFTAENIIFENSFNLYVCDLEAADTLVDINRAEELCGQDLTAYWSEKERPKRIMPTRPKEVGSTEVQTRFYRERASAISFTSEAKHCTLKNCRVIGRQDAFYGDHGAQVLVDGGALCGAVDYIFGGLELAVVKAELVAMIGTEKNDHCYISAGRGAPQWEIEMQQLKRDDTLYYKPVPMAEIDAIPADEMAVNGMSFYYCSVRHATEEELINPGDEPIYLGRPWRWWGRTSFVGVQAEEGVLHPDKWSLGLTKGHVVPWCGEGVVFDLNPADNEALLDHARWMINWDGRRGNEHPSSLLQASGGKKERKRTRRCRHAEAKYF